MTNVNRICPGCGQPSPLDAHHWNRPDQLGQHPHLPYLTLDTTHLATWGIEPVEVYEQFNGKVHHIHLSNFDGREHRRPEEGDLNLTAFLKKLQSTHHITLMLFALLHLPL